MFKTIKNAWSLPDLRKKILFTLLIIVVFRIGSVIQVPFLDTAALRSVMNPDDWSNTMLSYMNTLSGGAFSNATLFAMGITPYINSSIIIQLLCVAIPPLERLAREGEAGRRKISAITRYVTVGLGIIQGTAYYFYLLNSKVTLYNSGFELWFSAIVIILVFTAGTAVMMWLGEQINSHGIGNGISILLFAGIVAQFPQIINTLGQYWNLAVNGSTQFFFLVPLWVVLFVAVVWIITFMQDSERRIPIQYAKRVVGRKMYGGQTNHIPIKVAMAGVMPIIFAMSIMSLPATIGYFFGVTATSGHAFWSDFIALFSTNNVVYAILYFFLIIGFNYFYIAMQYNPVQIANDLKKNNGAIPGYRPGKPTSDFIHNSLSKVTLVGAIFLGIIAIFPIIFQNLTGITGLSLGGTTILIVVGVALETVRALESQMMMRHHKGFLE